MPTLVCSRGCNMSMPIERPLRFRVFRSGFSTTKIFGYNSDRYSDLNQEEDSSRSYDVTKYYPACIGELIKNKYRLISKLGWGGNSTVWLAKDTSRYASFISLALAVRPVLRFENIELRNFGSKGCPGRRSHISLYFSSEVQSPRSSVCPRSK